MRVWYVTPCRLCGGGAVWIPHCQEFVRDSTKHMRMHAFTHARTRTHTHTTTHTHARTHTHTPPHTHTHTPHTHTHTHTTHTHHHHTHTHTPHTHTHTHTPHTHTTTTHTHTHTHQLYEFPPPCVPQEAANTNKEGAASEDSPSAGDGWEDEDWGSLEETMDQCSQVTLQTPNVIYSLKRFNSHLSTNFQYKEWCLKTQWLGYMCWDM